MADNEKTQKPGNTSRVSSNKSSDTLINNFKEIQDALEISLYGNTKKDDIKALDDRFASIIRGEMETLTRHSSGDVTGFMTKLFQKDSKVMMNGQESSVNEIFGANDNEVVNFIADAYQNKKLKQNDLKEISNQLIELREAILVTRDAIISPDTTEGEISKTLKFDDNNEGDFEKYANVIKKMEEKFNINNTLKNFVIPNTLTQGEYFAYIYPYSKLFADFELKKEKDQRYSSLTDDSMYESTLYDLMTESASDDESENKTDSFDEFVKECADVYFTESDEREIKGMASEKNESALRKERNEAFKESMKEILNRISISPDEVPIPFLEFGPDSLNEVNKQFHDSFVFTEADNQKDKVETFKEKIKLDSGTYSETKKIERQYRNVGDCYLKFIESPRMIELKIMKKVLGYYYVMEDEIRPISGAISSTIYYNRFDDITRQKTIVDKITSRIVKSFNKKFLNSNKEFKELIASALMNYDLNTKRIKFQFIPAEYVCSFKVNEDLEGNGTSIIEPSLFYAKLYLMFLLFKIMSVVLYSNDTRVNYIKQSGIDKNVANKIQDIARKKQERKLNLMDLFSYTTLVKKIGSGTEMYIPVGRSGERGYETEILQGQDVQLNTEFMEFLRKCYILGTGVPDAIINYLNEADFAKSIEMANTKFASRVVSLQLDFNKSFTKFYQMLAKFSLGLPDDVCEKIKYILTAPKNANNSVKAEAIQNTQTLIDFLVSLMYGDTAKDDPNLANEILEFKKIIAAENLPMIHLDHLEEVVKKSKINATEKKLDPVNNNTDDIDNIDLGDMKL